MKTAAKVLLVGMLVLSPGVGVGAPGIPAGDAALAVPVSGKVAIVNEGRANTQLVAILYVAGVSTTQEYDVDVTLPVLGVPLQGEASVQMSSRATGVVAVADAHATGQARGVLLHGAAGDTTVSLNVDQPVHGFGSYDPAEATIHIRGTGGTGMFDGINLAGDLKGFFRPTGTLYLSYPSTDAALNAVERGLAQNAALTAAQRLAVQEQAKQALAQAQLATFPPDDTTQAIVTSTIQRTGTQVQVALRIVVPAGDARQVVKVVAVEPNGLARTVYQGSHAPGETVSALATGTPPFVVQVYVAGLLAKQITAPAQ
jgi:hypothetical protein